MNVDTFIRCVAMVMSWPKVNFHSVCLCLLDNNMGLTTNAVKVKVMSRLMSCGVLPDLGSKRIFFK